MNCSSPNDERLWKADGWLMVANGWKMHGRLRKQSSKRELLDSRDERLSSD